MDQLEGLGGADSHACRLSVGAALFAPVGCVDAQVALGRFVFERIPDRPVRPLRTGLDTPLTADAFGLIDHPHIAVISIHVSGLGRTILDTERRDALPAYSHGDVQRIFRERRSIPDDLNPGQGGIRFPLMAH